MHHSRAFADFVLRDGFYCAVPELVEFYAGIDRRREDAVERVTEDLRRMSIEFLERTKIAPGFQPLSTIRWTPSESALEELSKELDEGLQESSMPAEVKDALADASYSRARPYHQGVARFVERSSLVQLMQASRGAARVLRNSDYVTPSAKEKLLAEVLVAWERVSQILALLSPILASDSRASFEGARFVLLDEFEGDTLQERILAIVVTIQRTLSIGFKTMYFRSDWDRYLRSTCKTTQTV